MQEVSFVMSQGAQPSLQKPVAILQDLFSFFKQDLLSSPHYNSGSTSEHQSLQFS